MLGSSSASVAISRRICSSIIFLTISSGTWSKCVFVLNITTFSEHLDGSSGQVVRVISFANRGVALVGLLRIEWTVVGPERHFCPSSPGYAPPPPPPVLFHP